jgi:hypothetical protein
MELVTRCLILAVLSATLGITPTAAQSQNTDVTSKQVALKTPAAENKMMRIRLYEAEARAAEAEGRAAEAEARAANQKAKIDRLELEAKLKSEAAMIEPVGQIEFADGMHMMLLKPMSYQIGETGVEVTVPAGFVHDNASIPRVFWTALSPHGTYGKAAIVHDYLYWAQPCKKRLQADNLLLLAMLESNVSPAARKTIYRGVRLGGKASYESNQLAREQGKIRVVPANRRHIPPGATWDAYQTQLIKEGVRDPPFPPDTGFCALGNAVKVPHL